jgi:predicted GNAT family N-acyltransferase
VNIRINSFGESEEEIRFVRDTVFGEEQMVRRELDSDGMDTQCIHVVATDNRSNPIGAGRMQPDGKIGRLAVLKKWRGRGIGGRLLEALIESAQNLDLDKVHLHAQLQAVPFYHKCGFDKDGQEFLEAGIRHINMIRNTKQKHGEKTSDLACGAASETSRLCR